MNPNDPNVVLVEVVAARLGPLRKRLVFVGGCAAGLLITDPAQPAIRATEDVDVVVETVTLRDYHAMEKEVAALGFQRDLRQGAPICRWRTGEVVMDLMPVDETVLGFSNRWYPLAVRTARTVALPSGVEIRLIDAPAFIASKLDAFSGRGNEDYLLSHDLGDVIAVIDGREELAAEFGAADPAIVQYVADVFARLLDISAFRNALPGHLPGDAASQARLPDLEAKLHNLADLRTR